jgi:hypothetical protein
VVEAIGGRPLLVQSVGGLVVPVVAEQVAIRLIVRLR